MAGWVLALPPAATAAAPVPLTDAGAETRLVLSVPDAPKVFAEVLRGRTEGLRTLIAAGEDVNACDRQGVTPVMAATYIGQPALLEILLNAGADPNRSDRAGRTALYLAIRHGQVEATRLLLVKGARTVRIHADGIGALAYATQLGRRTQVELLMAAGADALTEGPGGAPIHYAAARQDWVLLEWLVGRGEDIGRPTAGAGLTPLMLTARFGSAVGVAQMISYHADLNQQDNDGWTALMHAVQQDRLENAEALLKAGADANVVGSAGESAYVLAGRRGHLALLRRLAAAGVAALPIRLAPWSGSIAGGSEERRLAVAMAAWEQHVAVAAGTFPPNPQAEAGRTLTLIHEMADGEELKRRLAELMRPEAAAEADVAELPPAEFQARIAAVADDPVRVVALRNARQQRGALGANGLLAWRLCHHNYLTATAVTAGWLTKDEAEMRMDAAARMLRAHYRSWQTVAPVLLAGLGAKAGGPGRGEALARLFLDETDPNSPWTAAPLLVPVRP